MAIRVYSQDTFALYSCVSKRFNPGSAGIFFAYRIFAIYRLCSKILLLTINKKIINLNSKLIFSLALLPLLISSGAHASDTFESLCQRLADPEPVVTLIKPTVRHNYSLNSMSITRLDTANGSSYRSDDRITTGLVVVDINTRVGVDVSRVMRDPAGRVCGRPRINVSFEMTKYDLYVGREFKPGSCEFNEILSHEMQHVHVYEQNLPALRDYFERMVKQLSAPFIFSSRDEMRAHLGKLQDYVGLTAENELAKIAHLHRHIDTHDEYSRLDNVCNQNIRNLVEK